MSNNALKRLLKAKKQADAEALLDAFVARQARTARRQITEYLDRFRAAMFRNLDREGGRRLMKGMLDDIEVVPDLDGLEDLYEAAGAEIAAAARKIVAKSRREFLRFRKAPPAPSVVFNEIDQDALDLMRRTFYWLRQDTSEHIQTELKDLIEKAFTGEIPRLDLPEHMTDTFGTIINQEVRYFKDVSDHIISQNQNLARIFQGQNYGVEYFRVLARLDHRTTRFCRSIHGRIITMGHLGRQAEKITAAKSIQDKKDAAPWVGGDYQYGNLAPNIGCPPYHFRCRTILQPYWPSSEDLRFIDANNRGWLVGDGVDISDVLAHRIQEGLRAIRKEGYPEDASKRMILTGNGVTLKADIENAIIQAVDDAGELYVREAMEGIFDNKNPRPPKGWRPVLDV